jgi:hypothetical protein
MISCPLLSRLAVPIVLLSLLPLPAAAERPSGAARGDAHPGGATGGDARSGTHVVTGDVPSVHRAVAETTWVRVHPPGGSPCAPGDVSGSSPAQTVEHVWCFEGDGGDSTWPAVPPAQNTGSRHEAWDHWSRFAPPVPDLSKWHVTTRHGGPATGSYNAWAGCDSLGTNPACSDVSYWVFQEGYADDWNYSLVLDCAGIDATAGGTLAFDLRYDCECNYDYLYLEYWQTSSSKWKLVEDAGGNPAVFNAVSGNFTSNPNAGRDCGDDFFGTSDQRDLGAGPEPYYGNSLWLTGVTFPVPAQSGGMKLRWRACSDGAWSDADGRGDTDGIGAVDNVSVTFNAGPTAVNDDFETGDFNGVVTTGPGTAASWAPGGLEGNTYDGWHLTFDPNYRNKGNTCTFTNDWMWAAKRDVGPIPTNQFDFFLVSPVIDCSDWLGGVVEYASYHCTPDGSDDWVDQLIRVYDSSLGWSPWQDIQETIIWDPGCYFWWMNKLHDLTPFLGPGVDSLQVAWEILDLSDPGDISWGHHNGVNYLIDNVSFGSFDPTVTVFSARTIDLFADTFSKSDPAHTPFLANAEQGMWSGVPGGTRDFANCDSLTVGMEDPDGITAANVVLWWRHDDGGSGMFGSWASQPMDFAIPDPLSPNDEGTYRALLGKDDGGEQDVDRTPGNGLIWKAGTTVEYYVRVVDDAAKEATFPGTASDPVSPTYFEFSVLPFGNTSVAQNGELLLLADDYARDVLDFETSGGFDPAGGTGAGGFADPAYVPLAELVESALADLGLVWDRYDVQGAGSSIQCEPRGSADSSCGLGGFLNDAGEPAYDGILWLAGIFADYVLADTTRLDLAEYLDGGGKLFVTGDEVAFHLGAGGNNADSTIRFLGDYLGTSFPTLADYETEERVLYVAGSAGTTFDGISQGLYGECPQPRCFDRLTLATPAPGSANEALLEYAFGGPGDNGRAAMISNTRTASGGVGVLAGFDVGALLSRDERACILGTLLASEFGLTVPAPPTCFAFAPGVPEVAAGACSFSLGAVSPNPFAGAATIRFSLPERVSVQLGVFDVRGRKVCTLVDEALPPGAYARLWDGRADDGEPVASGVYFLRMSAGDFRATRKALLLR